jgi:AraC family transcriptional regulator of arabinose operon
MNDMVENLNDSAMFMESPAPSPSILIADHFIEGYGYRVHRSKGTKDWLITFTLSGTGKFTIGSESILVKGGALMLLAPGTPHHYETIEHCTWNFMWTHFNPLSHWTGMMDWLTSKPGYVYYSMTQRLLHNRIETAFGRVLQDSLRAQDINKKLAMNALEEILLLIYEQHGEGKARLRDPRVVEVLSIISANMKESHSIESLARKVSLSPSRLSHLFKDEVGDSIVETLTKLRLKQAARLLEHTSRQIAEIAEDVGYRDAFYFTKQFHACYGMSPSKFRAESQFKLEEQQ